MREAGHAGMHDGDFIKILLRTISTHPTHIHPRTHAHAHTHVDSSA